MKDELFLGIIVPLLILGFIFAGYLEGNCYGIIYMFILLILLSIKLYSDIREGK